MTNPHQPAQREKKPKCYICKQRMDSSHPRYPKLCVECGNLNEQKRLARHDLTSYVALVTGGRVKIGYHTALRLLREGARVIVTTRFPYDAIRRYFQEPDWEDWKDRIHVYGLDFRRIDLVEAFAFSLNKQFPYIDIIVNNAAQTVRLPDEAYQALLQKEREWKTKWLGSGEERGRELPVYAFAQGTEPDDEKNLLLPVASPSRHPANLSPFVSNAWIAKPDQISLTEMLEVQLVNVTAPFLISTRLKPAMLRSPHLNRFIINVSSKEGIFRTKRKGRYHVHTNMAKASLNMMTLTMAKDYKRDRIFVNSVDPGWVSNQLPAKIREPIPPPLDCEDAAARICDPVYLGMDAKKPPNGQFFKDYRPVDW
ncbi:SDR family NAD(P)-dependent oxidoreductase [Thermoactinomyces intermedius]|uniref:SDR family NAD(P)-dependent oxidoreductase n=1 Tax=Thermoactinomyces intermedius TaxID=2024 RepID=A0A8I1A5F5_THEIN|nr:MULTISPECIES: SDR family NAD(P)-dependent oxidoreductase [Thermoactinomyces]MBA4548315.1 SDR family NAD(P)-dependent oxidoreductase [Thermoactinomyces intermedius]MBA4837456.1 SDR family NAD(P)-dependent oxidoreductase [Thermoactinomyces intermedius]MBH8595159.1 SDR family NAD(P)-dependent oxidoreductase [Thermoactinomyces intermedius]MBH8601902.1 SDR family NAD(P)-dependent oxidoreductase [Thermoactinomyces sp. CICC 23799]